MLRIRFKIDWPYLDRNHLFSFNFLSNPLIFLMQRGVIFYIDIFLNNMVIPYRFEHDFIFRDFVILLRRFISLSYYSVLCYHFSMMLSYYSVLCYHFSMMFCFLSFWCDFLFV